MSRCLALAVAQPSCAAGEGEGEVDVALGEGEGMGGEGEGEGGMGEGCGAAMHLPGEEADLASEIHLLKPVPTYSPLPRSDTPLPSAICVDVRSSMVVHDDA